jgi:hypothetical protein
LSWKHKNQKLGSVLRPDILRKRNLLPTAGVPLRVRWGANQRNFFGDYLSYFKANQSWEMVLWSQGSCVSFPKAC